MTSLEATTPEEIKIIYELRKFLNSSNSNVRTLKLIEKFGSPFSHISFIFGNILPRVTVSSLCRSQFSPLTNEIGIK